MLPVHSSPWFSPEYDRFEPLMVGACGICRLAVRRITSPQMPIDAAMLMNRTIAKYTVVLVINHLSDFQSSSPNSPGCHSSSRSSASSHSQQEMQSPHAAHSASWALGSGQSAFLTFSCVGA